MAEKIFRVIIHLVALASVTATVAAGATTAVVEAAVVGAGSNASIAAPGPVPEIQAPTGPPSSHSTESPSDSPTAAPTTNPTIGPIIWASSVNQGPRFITWVDVANVVPIPDGFLWPTPAPSQAPTPSFAPTTPTPTGEPTMPPAVFASTSDPSPAPSSAPTPAPSHQLFTFQVTLWSACSATCGYGTATRSLRCVQVARDAPLQPIVQVPATECFQLGLPQPTLAQNCSTPLDCPGRCGNRGSEPWYCTEHEICCDATASRCVGTTFVVLTSQSAGAGAGGNATTKAPKDLKASFCDEPALLPQRQRTANVASPVLAQSSSMKTETSRAMVALQLLSAALSAVLWKDA